ncbi:MAG: 2-dehydropantoate 2-reductase, partial [Tepidisphaerales bacterium]
HRLPPMSTDQLTFDATHPRIAVVGSGAVGTYYGARLADHGHDVHFLLRSDYATVVKQGWSIQSCLGDFVLRPDQINVYDNVMRMPKADLVLVCLKTVSNDQFEPLIGPLLHPGTLILTLQNGLGNEEQLAGLFGRRRVLGGMAFVCLNRIGPGRVQHIDQGWIQIGDFSGGLTPRINAIGELFNTSGVQCSVLENLMLGRWDKLVWNVPFNGLGAALDLTTDKLIGTEAGLEMVTGLMREVVAAAAAQGLVLRETTIERKLNHTRTMGAYKTSMQIDRHERRPMELESILGEPLRAARRAGIAVPQMEALYAAVKIVNAANIGR